MRSSFPNFFLFIVLIAFSSCTNKEEVAEKAAYDAVMAVHEEIMPKDGEIEQLKADLNRIKDSLPDEMAEQKVQVVGSILKLKETHDHMMDWMNSFKKPEGKNHAENMKYLTGQLDSIKAVSNETYLSIGFANKAIRTSRQAATTK
jgi:hypothetical protein